MWDQPRFQLTVHKTRGVKAKGKYGTNDLYAVVVFANEKHKTSVVERCIDAAWEQNCHLNFKGNETGSLLVKVCHRNFLLSSDELIGQVEILLKHFTFYESPKTSWFKLSNKASKNEGEIQLTLTYNAIMPATFDNSSMTTSIKGFAKRLPFGKDSKRRRKESLCDLTKRDGEKDKELSALQIVPTDLKCLYWHSSGSEEEKGTEEVIRRSKKTSNKDSGNMVNLVNTRRHSISLLNNKKSLELSCLDNSNCRNTLHLDLDDSTNFSYPNSPDGCSFDEHLSAAKSTNLFDSKLNKSALSRRDISNLNSPSKTPSKATFHILDRDNSANESDHKSSDSKLSTPSEAQTDCVNAAEIKSPQPFQQDTDKKGIPDEHMEFLREVGGRMLKSVEEMNSRNLLSKHFNQFTKQELLQLVLDQREWIKARELYILEIEDYQKKLLMKVLDQSSKGTSLKRGVRNSIIEEINLGVNHVLQKQRLNAERASKVKVEGMSFAKKWFGTLFKAK